MSVFEGGGEEKGLPRRENESVNGFLYEALTHTDTKGKKSAALAKADEKERHRLTRRPR